MLVKGFVHRLDASFAPQEDVEDVDVLFEVPKF